MPKNLSVPIIIIVVLVVAGGIFLLQRGGDTDSAIPVDIGQENLGDNIVVYTDNGYSPNVLQVELGDAVVFKNESSGPMRPASAIHPVHSAYPTTGGCLGSTFDACKALSPGSSWSFQFDEQGSWRYHDHLSPFRTATIVVQEQ